MSIEAQKRQQLIRKIYRIPSNKLDELEKLISKIELKNEGESGNLSFAGAWQNIDDSVISDLTDNLIKKRQKNQRRNINE